MNLTTLRTAIKSWLAKVVGDQHVFTIDFDSDFVTDNVIGGTISSQDIYPVTYATSHADTLQELAFSIQNMPLVQTAIVTDDRQITVTAYDSGLTLVPLVTVSDGATQAIASYNTTQEASTVPIFFMNQVMPKLTEVCLFNFINVRRLGVDGYQKVDPETNLSLLVGNRIATLNIAYIGENAFTKASKIFNALSSDAAVSEFRAQNISVFGRQDLRDLTGLMDTEFQQRVDFDCYVRFFEETQEDRGSIEHIVIGGNVNDDAGEVTINPIDIYTEE